MGGLALGTVDSGVHGEVNGEVSGGMLWVYLPNPASRDGAQERRIRCTSHAYLMLIKPGRDPPPHPLPSAPDLLQRTTPTLLGIRCGSVSDTISPTCFKRAEAPLWYPMPCRIRYDIRYAQASANPLPYPMPCRIRYEDLMRIRYHHALSECPRAPTPRSVWCKYRGCRAISVRSRAVFRPASDAKSHQMRRSTTYRSIQPKRPPSIPYPMPNSIRYENLRPPPGPYQKSKSHAVSDAQAYQIRGSKNPFSILPRKIKSHAVSDAVEHQIRSFRGVGEKMR